MTCDGHQVTLCRHYVAQQSQVTVVNVQTVELQHRVHFLLYRFTNSFDTQYTEDLANVVTECSHGIDVALTQNLHHRRAVSFQQPFSDSFELTGLGDDDSFLRVGLWELKNI